VLASRLKENEPTIIRINDKDFIVTKSSDNKINFINPDTLKNSKLEPKFLDFEDKKLIFHT
jgi:NMD protein affecting ribosome stability and mRNA decay